MEEQVVNTEFFNNHGPIKQTSLKEQAYLLIKDAILYRRLQPGVVYSQETLGQELAISRTPIREALLELQSQRYISFVRGRGFEVRSLSKKEAADIIEMREQIEIIGARFAAERITNEQIKKLEDSLEDMLKKAQHKHTKTLYHVDYDFHNIIFEATGNSWLRGTIKNLRDQFLRVETQSAFDQTETTMEVYREHKAIVDALKKHDADAAAKAMEDHMRITYNRTVKPILDSME